MKKLLVLLVFFVAVFLFNSSSVFAENETGRKKKITTTEELAEDSSAVESSGLSVNKGGAVKGKTSVKKPVVKKKLAVKKSQPSSSKKTAASKRSSKRYSKKTVIEEDVETEKPEPPKGPSPCDACDLKPRGFVFTNEDTVGLQGSLKCAAHATFKYSEPATKNTLGKIVVGEPPIDVPFDEGARINMYTTDPLLQKVIYTYWLEAKTKEGVVCRSDTFPFWAQPPEPIAVLAKKDSWWNNFYYCASGFLISKGGAALVKSGSQGPLMWAGIGFGLSGLMNNDGNITSGNVSSFSACMMLGPLVGGKKTGGAGNQPTQANPPPATTTPSAPPAPATGGGGGLGGDPPASM